MTIGELIRYINKSENRAIIVCPQNKIVLNVKPGNFISIQLNDMDKISQISEEYISSISVINNMISITI